MYFLIVSGMSGAGKSRAVAALEDLGFYCVDNMPIALMPKFAEICLAATERYERVALVTDVRGGTDFNTLHSSLESIAQMGCDYKILFLDTATSTLINRYKETRRKHPVMEDGISMSDAIAAEREMLEGIRGIADFVVDTTKMTPTQLREHIINLFTGEKKGVLEISVMSFGFKYGIPAESDLVFDVRFLPNPYYDLVLRPNNGTDRAVRDFVFSDGLADQFMDRLTSMIDFLIPQYIEEGKTSLVISIGCTGGKHRSVAIAEELNRHITQKGFQSIATHRDYRRG